MNNTSGATLSNRHEFLFLYDVRMANPNGDPDENRPRRLPDGTFYVTDVRLKRFVRDWLKTQGQHILVDRPEDAATNLAGRIKHFLEPDHTPPHLVEKGKAYIEASSGKKPDNDAAGRLLVEMILDAFIDARLFGSSLALKDWKIALKPKTLTGAVQINMGEVINRAEEVDIAGTSIFASDEAKTQGTFTTFYALRYGLIAFNGVANEHSARLSRLTDADYETFLLALWKCVGGAPTANTRSKTGQVPRLLVDVSYKPKSEFQFGRLMESVSVEAKNDKPETQFASPHDFTLNVSRLIERLKHDHVAKVRVAIHPDLETSPAIPQAWERFDPDAAMKEG